MLLNVFARCTVLGLVLCAACVEAEGPATKNDAGPGAREDSQRAREAGTDAHVPKVDARASEGEQIDSGQPGDIMIPKNVGPLSVEIGVPDSSSGLGFVPLSPGGEIPIAGLGQAGLTARIAVRVTTSDGTSLERAFVRVQVVNEMDGTRVPAIRQFDVADVLRCEPDAWCYAATIRVEISHLAKLPELEGTQVTVSATVAAERDEKLSGTAHTWGYLASVQ